MPVQLTNPGFEEATLLKGSDVGTFFAFSPVPDGEFELCDGQEARVNAVAEDTKLGTDECGSAGQHPEMDLSECDFSQSGKTRLQKLLIEYGDIFSRHYGDPAGSRCQFAARSSTRRSRCFATGSSNQA